MKDWLKALIRVEISRHLFWGTFMPYRNGDETIERLKWLSSKFPDLYDEARTDVMGKPFHYYEISASMRRYMNKLEKSHKS